MFKLSQNLWSIILSLGLHLAAVGVMTFNFKSTVNIPYGVDLAGNPTSIEKGEAENSLVYFSVNEVKSAIQDPDSEVISTKEMNTSDKSQSSIQSSFGSETGTATEGSLGHAHGFKASARERYIYELRRHIEAKKIYPSTSKKFRETGHVKIQFSVQANGEIKDVKLSQECHHHRLNTAALQLVSSIQKYRPFPKEIESESLQLELPIEYSIN